MANFYITHHQYPSNPHLFTVNLDKVRGKGVTENSPNISYKLKRGEPLWKLFIYTTGLDSNGDSVSPVIVDVAGSHTTVNELIEAKIAELCGLIDWSQQGVFSPETDKHAPVVVEQFPTVDQTNVPISSPVVIRVKDIIPGDGIDPSTVSMKVDGFTVIPDVVGNKYDYTFSFRPRPIFDD